MRIMRRPVIAVVLALTPVVAGSSTSVASGGDCSGRAAATLKRCAHAADSSAPSAGKKKLRFFTTTNPTTDPALHGTQPHGQGTVAALDVNPNSSRPLPCNTPPGSDAAGQTCNPETVVVGRSRGIQRADGTYHGHITVAAIAGNEIVGVDTNPGESKAGPLDAVQQALLTPLCNASPMGVCLSAVVANSATTTTGSTNHFQAANLVVGGPTGISASAASSDGNIGLSANGTCQTATGASQVANATGGGMVLATVAQSNTNSTACQNAAPTQTNTSSVIGIGGTGVPIPAAGCANGTANTQQAALSPLLTVICNADDGQPGTSGNQPQATAPYGVREALDVFVLSVPTLAPARGASGAARPAAATSTLLKATTGAAESLAVAPAVVPTTPTPTPTPTPAATPTPASTAAPAASGAGNVCNPNLQSCPNGAGSSTKRVRCNSNGDNDCVTGSGPFGPRIPEGGATDRARDCAEGVTNEGPTSCSSGPAAARTRSSLPFTGFDLVPLGIAGLLLLTGGALLLRRRSGGSQVD